MKRYVQYGCGFTAPKDWVNYDASPTLRFERLPLLGLLYTRNKQRFPKNVKFGDIVKGLPEAPASCDAIYCSHVLEHLSYDDFLIALKNTHLLLKPGGVFRGVVPDIRSEIFRYIETYDEDLTPANEFMLLTKLGIKSSPRTFAEKLKALYGNNKHLWMWDYKTIACELDKAGFRNIRPIKFGDSADPAFKLVEEEKRFLDAAAFECEK